MLFAELLGCVDSLPEKIPGDILSRLNEGRSEELIPEELVDPDYCPEVKQRLNSYKFLDHHEFRLSEFLETLHFVEFAICGIQDVVIFRVPPPGRAVILFGLEMI